MLQDWERKPAKQSFRVLRIITSSERDKAIILRNSTKLRSINEVEYLKKVFITPDMPHSEREQNKTLHSRLKEMNQDGNKYWIKNGQIVLREKQTPSAQSNSQVLHVCTLMHKALDLANTSLPVALGHF